MSIKRETLFCCYRECNNTFERPITGKESIRKYCCHKCSTNDNIGISLSKKTREKIGIGNRGKKRTKETKQLLSKVHLGDRISREIRFCECGCNETFKCKINSKQRFIYGHYSQVMWKNAIWKEKHLKTLAFKNLNIKPNKPEIQLSNLLQELLPNQYKFVGDGKVFINCKCPDFININGQKKIIEMFGDYWHGTKVTGISNKQHEQERINHFAKYGYQTLIIWQHELEDTDSILDKVKEFSCGKT